MAAMLRVYREVAFARESQDESRVAIISYDEKPSIQAIGNAAPGFPPRRDRTRHPHAVANTSAMAR